MRGGVVVGGRSGWGSGGVAGSGVVTVSRFTVITLTESGVVAIGFRPHWSGSLSWRLEDLYGVRWSGSGR